MDAPANVRSQTKKITYALLITALSPLLPQILGSAFNIWYNVIIVDPLLTTAALQQRFLSTVIVYNSICYPVVAYLWLRLVYSLRPALTKIERGEPISEPMLQAARRRVIHLPFLGAIIFGLAWLLCIPIFIFSLAQVNHGLDSRLLWHLPVSFGVSGFISLTHSFFLVELASNWGLFPVPFSACPRRSDAGSENSFVARPRVNLGDLCGHLSDRILTLTELCARFGRK